MDAFAKHGRPVEAEKLLRDMLTNTDGAKPNAVSFATVMNAWSVADVEDSPERCERLLTDMKELASVTGRKELAPDTICYNIVMGEYARRGRPVEAERVLRGLPRNDRDGAKPDVVSLNSVLKAWSRSTVDNAPEQCDRLLSEMK